ncbi:MAG: hypothetical protein LBR26_15980 [Prevotella sp.]|jgi:hypothetical protein|nr:hypothetical protein [Prevotella sp.]
MKQIELNNNPLWQEENLIIGDENLLEWDVVIDACKDNDVRLPLPNEYVDLAALGSTWDKEKKGRWFGTDHYLKDNSKGSIFLPADGFRDADGTLYYAGEFGYYWSASPYDRLNAYSLIFSRTHVSPHIKQNEYTLRKQKFSVRTVIQKQRHEQNNLF